MLDDEIGATPQSKRLPKRRLDLLGDTKCLKDGSLAVVVVQDLYSILCYSTEVVF